MIQHHPDDNLLAEYSAGALAWALSLGVATHLHFCSECRNRVTQMNKIGAVLLDSCQAQKIPENALDQVLRRIQLEGDSVAMAPAAVPTKRIFKDTMLNDLPKLVARLIPDNQPLRWQFVSPALKMARLRTGQNQYEVAFHRINSGGKVPEHDHKGLEVTVVLKGSFSDENGIYTPGDFMVRQKGEVHRPTAAQNQDCLCFSITESPVYLTSLLGKLINPFLRVKPA